MRPSAETDIFSVRKHLKWKLVMCSKVSTWQWSIYVCSAENMQLWPNWCFLGSESLKWQFVICTKISKCSLSIHTSCKKFTFTSKLTFSQFRNIENVNLSSGKKFPLGHNQITSILQKMCPSTKTDVFSIRKSLKCLFWLGQQFPYNNHQFTFVMQKKQLWAEFPATNIASWSFGMLHVHAWWQ